MSHVKSECRKFSPNIFNKSKCQNCFASKDLHSAEALDSNRVSRKVSKCGYLFVAPDWDFSDPINRTKRWQRRWFVLFDDGELTYSVDEHPETVPQAIIDMTKVLEVSNGEDLTGNQFAIAIIAPEKVHFVKGTSREESKWWFDVLAIFPRSIKGTRHKRNATFPGGVASAVVCRPTEELEIREAESDSSNDLRNNKGEIARAATSNKNAANIVSVNNKKNSRVSCSTPRDGDIRTRRIAKRGIQSSRSLSDGVNLMIPKKREMQSTIDDKKRNAYIVTVTDTNDRRASTAIDNESIGDANDSTPAESTRDYLRREKAESERFIPIPRLIDPNGKLTPSKLATDSNYEKREGCESLHLPDSNIFKEQIRGDPDGCGLELKLCHCSVDPVEGHVKKGWLLKHDASEDWVKVWCVLKRSCLECYDDCSDEANGVLSGVVPLNRVSSIQKLVVDGRHSFQLVMRDGEVRPFAAITAGIRAAWMCALRSAITFPRQDSTSEPLVSLGEKIEREMSLLNDSASDGQHDPLRTSLDVPSSPRSGFSSDDDFKTASEASGRTEDYFEWADEDIDQSSSSSRALPPSPPLNRTPMSRVKERAKTRSSSRLGTHCEFGKSSNSRTNKEDASKDDLSGSDREVYLTPKLKRRNESVTERDSNCAASDVPESMMVELLEAEVESLKSQLERCQREVADSQKNGLKSHKMVGVDSQASTRNRDAEIDTWQQRHAELLCRYHGLKKRHDLLEQMNAVTERERYLLVTCEALEKKFRSEKCKWDQERRLLEDERQTTRCTHQETIEGLEERVNRSETKMTKLTHDIELLNKTRTEAESRKDQTKIDEPVDDKHNLSSHVDSLSDLSDVSFLDDGDDKGKKELVDEMQKRLRKTVAEIRILQKEVRRVQAVSDEHELCNAELRRAMELAKEDYEAQLKLMTRRIEDLTGKLSSAEKQNRQLRQKMARAENKEQKRTRSLKGKEVNAIPKELETKAEELGKKLPSLENICVADSDQSDKLNSCPDLRSSMDLLVRINSLDSRVDNAACKLTELNSEEVNDYLYRDDAGRSGSDDVSSPRSVLRRLNEMLAQKMAFYKEKESMLAQLGLLNKKTRARMNLEKIVREANLIGQIGGILRTISKDDVLRRECRRLNQQLVLFEKKLARLDFRRNSGERKEGEAKEMDGDSDEMVPRLISYGRKINECANAYKTAQLDVLATALAKKAFGKSLEGTVIDVLSQKLAQVEIKRIVSSVSHLRQEEEEQWCFDVRPSPSQRQLREAIHDRLQRDIDSVLNELHVRFKRGLTNSQCAADATETVKSAVDSNLAEFIDVIAHNSILMARLDFIDDLSSSRDRGSNDSDAEFSKLSDQIFDRELELMHCDVEKCASNLFHGWRHRNSETAIEFPVSRKWSMRDILATTQDGKPSLFLNSYQARFQRSFRQRGQRSVTMPICCPVENPSEKEPKCDHCHQLEERIEELRRTNEEDKKQMKQIERQLTATEQKLAAKEEESKLQIAALKETYSQEDANRNNAINEETIRQKYQAEIEQLRGLCEKGLVAMENSHRRIIAELEEKHNREIEQLQIEKDQALAEETHATLAALDAMRKAHEAELQREIAKFKQEFLEKMQSTHEMDLMQKEQEEEIETIKEGILSLSEKYSIKCLENATLEERLKPLLQQLTDANELAFDLTARNKQLRALLSLNNAELTASLESSTSSDQVNLCRSKLRENETREKDEEIRDLKRQLREAHRHKSDLDSRCRQLDQSLKAERRLREDEVSSLRDRLERVILTSNASLEVLTLTRVHAASYFPPTSLSARESCNLSVSPRRELPAVGSSESQAETVAVSSKLRHFSPFTRGRELMRSPSCPGLNNEIYPEMLEPVGTPTTDKKRLFRVGKSFC